MKRHTVITGLVALGFLAAVFGYKFLAMRRGTLAQSRMKPPPATVAVATPHAESWHRTIVAVATLETRQGVMIRNELEGQIVRVAFASGAAVKQGDPLVDLDTQKEEAQLKGLVAAARLAELSLARARELRANGSNAAADLDGAEATYAQAVAACEQVRVTIAKKHIVAPFSGRLGITQVSAGQYLRVADPIVQLEALDPIYADFGVPQRDLPEMKPGLAVEAAIDAFPGQSFQGRIEAVNPRVSDDTRNVRIRAVLPNADEHLRPGMFGQVHVTLAEAAPVLVVPATAIVYSPYGDSVFVIEDGVARQKFVHTGGRRGDLVAIASGLDGREQVVVAGQLKLRNGSPTRIDNQVVPDAQPAPTPKES